MRGLSSPVADSTLFGTGRRVRAETEEQQEFEEQQANLAQYWALCIRKQAAVEDAYGRDAALCPGGPTVGIAYLGLTDPRFIKPGGGTFNLKPPFDSLASIDMSSLPNRHVLGKDSSTESALPPVYLP